MRFVIVYCFNNLGAGGDNYNWIEPYIPKRTIGDIIKTMTINGLNNKKIIKFLKLKRGVIKFQTGENIYLNNNTKISELAHNYNIVLVYRLL